MHGPCTTSALLCLTMLTLYVFSVSLFVSLSHFRLLSVVMGAGSKNTTLEELFDRLFNTSSYNPGVRPTANDGQCVTDT